MALRLALICHAPTTATRTGSFPADEPLDGPGLDKARSVSAVAGHAADYVRSPALAARQTAEAMQLSARVVADLRECDYGRWAGRALDAVQAADPEGVGQWLSDPASRPHGGEALTAVLARVAAWLSRLDDEATEVVGLTHASVTRAAIVAALDAPPQAFWRIDVLPLSVTRLRRDAAGRWTLVSSNQRLTRARDLRVP